MAMVMVMVDGGLQDLDECGIEGALGRCVSSLDGPQLPQVKDCTF